MGHAPSSVTVHGLVTSIFVAAPLVFGAVPAAAAVLVDPGGLLEELRDPAAALVQPTHCRAWRTWRHRC